MNSNGIKIYVNRQVILYNRMVQRCMLRNFYIMGVLVCTLGLFLLINKYKKILNKNIY